MARPKEFDREEVLRKAIPVFTENGFAGTSTEDLVRAMGIGRQSLYDTFGDKRRLYVEALRAYNTDSIGNILKRLRSEPDALAAIERLLMGFADEKPTKRLMGCFGVNAICELGVEDADVRAASETSAAVLERSLADLVDEGKAKGSIKKAINSRAAARFLATTLSGMKVQAKGGASTEALREVARFAVQSLAPR